MSICTEKIEGKLILKVSSNYQAAFGGSKHALGPRRGCSVNYIIKYIRQQPDVGL